MGTKLTAFLACLVALAMGGCNQPGIDDPSLVVIEGPKGSTLRFSAANTSKGVTDGVSVEVSDGRLRLNGKDFGTVKRSDKVKIDTEGIVTVNGVKRKEGG
jgi:hypothetical protein